MTLSVMTAVLGLLGTNVLAPAEDARTRTRPRVALELEAIENTVDGCEACGCRVKSLLEAREPGSWWVAFGAVKPHPKEGWQTRLSSSHCGTGLFDKTNGDFRRTVGTPYVVLDLSTQTVVGSDRISMRAVLAVRKLTGFAESGQPTYVRTTRTQTLPLEAEADVTLPLFLADEREREAFGVHEVLLRLRATPLGTGPAGAYGSVAVTADEPGAEILLDGGLVGRVAEGRPTVLNAVLVGQREITVRDFSGRVARLQVRVEEAKTVDATLKVLPLAPLDATRALASIGRNAQGHDELWRVKDGAIVVRIPGGEFLMGSREGEGQADERPQRQVYISDFLIDKTEVTWRQLRKLAQATGRALPPAPIWGSADDYSAANLTWVEAQEYCEWVGGRLPTEAEWEKAARGTDGRRYPWGDTWDPTRCNSISGGPHRPEPLGTFPECLSPYGILDTSGSIWEWCADWYGADYYAQSPPRDPKGPAAGMARVLRGGDWISQPLWVRAAYRFKVPPTSRNASHGFRCAQDITP